MGEQFLLTGQAAEVVADHLVGAEGRLATGPQGDEQAGDDAQIGLDRYSVFAMTQQVPTAQHMLEEPEERFDGPAMFVDQGDDFGGDVQQVRGDEQGFPLRRSGIAGTSTGLTTRLATDLHDAQGTISQRGVGFPTAETHPDVAGDLRRNGVVAEWTLFEDLEGAVVADAADERRTDLDDLAEQAELDVAAIHDVDASGLQGGFENVTFAGVAVGQVHAHRHALEQLELGVQLEGFVAVVEPKGFDQFGKRRQQRAVDQGQHTLDVAERGGTVDGLQGVDELADDAAEQIGVKDPGRFGERTQRGPGTTQQPLNFLQLTGLLNGPQTGDDGIEEVEQDEGGVLVVMQDAVAGLVSSASFAMQLLQHGEQQFEMLEPVKVGLSNRGFGRSRHPAQSMRYATGGRK